MGVASFSKTCRKTVSVLFIPLNYTFKLRNAFDFANFMLTFMHTL